LQGESLCVTGSGIYGCQLLTPVLMSRLMGTRRSSPAQPTRFPHRNLNEARKRGPRGWAIDRGQGFRDRLLQVAPDGRGAPLWSEATPEGAVRRISPLSKHQKDDRRRGPLR